MEDILDADERKNKPGKLFSILGFGFALITPLFCIRAYNNYQRFIQVKASSILFSMHPNFHLENRCAIIGIFLGFLFSILSLIRKEQIKIIKPVGISLNLLWTFLFTFFISHAILS